MTSPSRSIMLSFLGLAVAFLPVGWIGSGEEPNRCSERNNGAAVSEAISKRGAPTVLKECFSDDQSWEGLLNGVGSGDSGWLRVAKQIQGTLDAGAARDLQMAVGRALERNPTGVLLLLKDGFSGVGAVCGLSGIEDDLPEHFEEAQRTVKKRRATVKGVAAADLQARKRECVEWLDRLEAEMRKNRERWFVPR